MIIGNLPYSLEVTSKLMLESFDKSKAIPITAIENTGEPYYNDKYVQTSLDELKDILIKPKEPPSSRFVTKWTYLEPDPSLEPRRTEEEWNKYGNFMFTMQNIYGNNLTPETREKMLKETEFWSDEVLREKMLSLMKDNATMIPSDKWNPTRYYITHVDAEKMYATLTAMKTERELNALHNSLMKNDSSLSRNAQDYLMILRKNNPDKTITIGTFNDNPGQPYREVIEINNKDRTSITIRKDVLEIMASRPQYEEVWSQILTPDSPIYNNMNLLNVFIDRVKKELAVT